MLSLFLLLAILSWTIYRIRKKKKIFPKELFFGKDEKCETRSLIAFLVICLIFVSYVGIIVYIQTYDSKLAQINELKNNIVQLELQIDELDKSINELSICSNLSTEESITLKGLIAYRAELETEIATNNAKLSELPGNIRKNIDLRKLYKFLLYFG